VFSVRHLGFCGESCEYRVISKDGTGGVVIVSKSLTR
jgi:hypothetical protein